MPLYVYECIDGHRTEDMRKVGERHDPSHCYLCGKTANLTIQPSAFDPKMGCDPGFPTAYEKWAKVHSKAAKVK